MLNILFNKLNSILPIKAIVEKNSTVEVEYVDDPSPEQLEIINTIITSWPLEKNKLDKIQTLDSAWKQVVNAGWQTPDGYKLGIDISDVALLNGAFTLAKEASLIGINDPISIVDIDGQSHPMNLQDLTLLMLQYGQARATLSSTYASIKQSINSAASLEELEAININI